MSRNKYLLDTCFILGFINNNQEVLKQFGAIDIDDCYISTINRIELLGYSSLSQDDEVKIKAILNYIDCLSLDDKVEQQTIQLRKHHKIKLPDAIVLATALTHHCQLLTLDNGLNNKYLAQIQ